MIIRVTALLVAALAACSGSDGPAPTTLRQSQVLLQAPPEVYDTSVDASDRVYFVLPKGVGNQVRFFDTHSEAEATLTFTSHASVLLVYVWLSAGQIYYLVGCVSSNHVFSLYRIHDADGDALPDLSTQTLLLDSGSAAMFPTALTRIANSSDAYLLDRRCQDILRAADTDADGFPDQLSTFALSADFEELLPVRGLLAGSGSAVLGLLVPVTFDELSIYLTRFPGPHKSFKDTDSDGTADTAVDWTWNEDPVVAAHGRPYRGQQSIEVMGYAGKTVQVWLLHATTLQPETLLGGAQISDASVWTGISLSQPLTLDRTIRLRYSDKTQGIDLTVIEDWPQIHAIVPAILDRAGGALAIEGFNLTANTAVRLRTAWDFATASFGSVQTVPITVQDAQHATVTIPALDLAARGRAELETYDPGRADSEGKLFASFSIAGD